MPATATEQQRRTREPGDESGNRPVWEKRMGRITCSVWPQENDKGKKWYSVSISRIYRVNDQWKRSTSFSLNDLPLVARLAALAMDWIHFQAPRPNQA